MATKKKSTRGGRRLPNRGDRGKGGKRGKAEKKAPVKTAVAPPSPKRPTKRTRPHKINPKKRTRPHKINPKVTATEKRAKANQKAIAAKAKADIKLIKTRTRRIKSDFYDVGLALARLKKKSAYSSVGHKSFRALVRAELDISTALAERLASIASEVSREVAERVGPTHAYALVALCRATPEADTPEGIEKGTIQLPDGTNISVNKATTREKDDAARKIRDGRGKVTGGRAVSKEQRATAFEMEATLRALGLERARVRAAMPRGAKEAELELEGIPFSGLGVLCAAICP